MSQAQAEKPSRAELPSRDATNAPWRPTRFDRAFSKDLFYRDGASVILNRFEPGATNFAHKHPYRQIRYILEGNIIVNGRTYGPGCVIDFPADTIYEVACPDGGSWLIVQLVTDKGVLPVDRSKIDHDSATTTSKKLAVEEGVWPLPPKAK